MNKPMVVWGLLLFAGFLATHYLVFSVDGYYTIPLWLILAAAGVAYCKLSCGCVGKKKCTCFSCSDLLVVGVAEAVILTVAISIQLLPISPFYILSVWLLCLGSAMLAESLRERKSVKMQLGAFWLFCAVFFPFVSNYEFASFTAGALVLGVPLMLAGIVQKE